MIIFTAVVLYGLFTVLVLNAPDSLESPATTGGSGSGSGNQKF